MCEVAIIHPDLGIGGAERLVIDVARAVKTKHPVTSIWTSRYEKDRAFKDAADFPIHVYGSHIPMQIFGCFHIFFALLKSLYLVIQFSLKSSAKIVVIDQISAWVPILRLLRPDIKIIFYCHFPDLLLAPHTSALRRLYRIPFDAIEKFGIRSSHVILVNSKFTAGKVKDFLGIDNVEVLYPCVDCNHDNERQRPKTPVFISLNRYERKKNHGLAIEALALVTKKYPEARLIIAGGYDPAVLENVEHEKELMATANYNGVTDRVEFRRNITDSDKWDLIAKATAMIYTPQNEHFGIVPLEALTIGTPCIGCNSGGPLETLNCEGCKLCNPTPKDFAQAMIEVFEDVDRTKELKEHARKFGFGVFTEQWIALCDRVSNQ